MTSANLNIDELKETLEFLITNNRFLQGRGKVPGAVEIVGDSGIGKTSTVLQLGDILGLDVVKLNLAQIEELGDLVGFPIRQFQVCKDIQDPAITECIWIDEHAVDEYRTLGYTFTGENRTSYCPPQWIAGREGGGILMLDDYNRADPRFLQACMDLIDRQEYISWKLPQDWHILLTCNPDDGDYHVNAMDDAQKTRFSSLNLKFDISCWGRWAEGDGIDSRCINFLLMHPELVTKKVNARSISRFFNNLMSIPVFEDKLPLVQILGEGSVGPEFSSMFTMFINNKLDRLISPQDILFGKDEKKVIEALTDNIKGTGNYRGDIASVLATRIVNFSVNFANDNPIPSTFVDRLKMIIMEDIFTNDLKYSIVRSIFNGNKVKFRTLTASATLNKYILA